MKIPYNLTRSLAIKAVLLAGLVLSGALLASIGCSSKSSPTTPATFDIRGVWTYITLKGTDTWDTGAFTLTGHATLAATLRRSIFIT